MKRLCVLLLGAALLTASGCKKDKEAVKIIPSLSTTAATEITPTTAKTGGSISDNGGAEISEAGVVYSKTNATPTLSDTKVTATVSGESFVVALSGLEPGSTYYVRAYASNSVGTGYGAAVSFMTGNAAPEARNVQLTGGTKVDDLLTASYSYFDAENNAESGSIVKWYIANDTISAAVTTISGADTLSYRTVAANQSKFIRVGITPKASAGTSPGTEVKSRWVGPIGAAATTVSFMYNGVNVTYGIITSPVTGRKWLDRNLGAPNVATAYDDYANAGDVFQWGRGDDGHQLVTRLSANEIVAVNGTTGTKSTTDTPVDSRFITAGGNLPWDWRNPSNDNLWQAPNQVNNPCPVGFHIPTYEEWQAENLILIQDAYTQLKLTRNSYRDPNSGNFSGSSVGFYWTSTLIRGVSPGNGRVMAFWPFDVGTNIDTEQRSAALACKCIKD